MQGGLTTHSGGVSIGIVLDKVDDDVHMTHEGGHMKRRQSRLHT